MMRISPNGNVALADDFTNVIGSVGNGVHTVVFTVTTSALKYNVTVFPESGPAITAENKPMITDNPLYFNNPAHPIAWLFSRGIGTQWELLRYWLSNYLAQEAVKVLFAANLSLTSPLIWEKLTAILIAMS